MPLNRDSTSQTLTGWWRLTAEDMPLCSRSGAHIVTSATWLSPSARLHRPLEFIPSSLVRRILIGQGYLKLSADEPLPEFGGAQAPSVEGYLKNLCVHSPDPVVGPVTALPPPGPLHAQAAKAV